MRARKFLLLVALLTALGLAPGHAALGFGFRPIRATVLFFNDLHGHLTPFMTVDDSGSEVEVGGIARLAALAERIEKENARAGIATYILVAGDILQGTPMSTVFRGRPDVLAMNVMGVDAMTVGNHEFDFGLDNFLALRELADFPFLSSNIERKQTRQLLCDPYVSLPLAGPISLTVIGVTTPEMLYTTHPKNVTDLAMRDPVQTVKAAFDETKGRGPVILLSHSRHRTDAEIANAAPGLVAIIGGHDQILLDPRREINGVPVFQAFEKGKHLGRLDLVVNPVTGKTRLADWSYIPVTRAIAADPEVEAIIERYDMELDVKFKEEIGQALVFLDGERERVRYEETNLGNFVTDVMRSYTGAEVALLNAGSLRASIAAGPVTVEEVFRAMPYSNELVMVELSGAEIMWALDRSVMGERADEDGGFLQVSGISFVVRGRSVDEVMVGGEPLDRARTYRVAITDFMAAGGDGYEVFVGKDYLATGLPLRELLVETIRERGQVSARVEGRIRREKEE